MAKIQQLRIALVHLVRHEGVSVRTACHTLNMSRPTAYKWLRRYDADPTDALCDRSRRPHRSPNSLSEDVKSNIIEVHRATGLGPRGLRRRLSEASNVVPSVSTISRILRAARPAAANARTGQSAPSSLENLCLELLELSQSPNRIFIDRSASQELVQVIRTGTIRERKRAALVALIGLGETRTRSARAVRSCRASAKKYWEAFQKYSIDSILNPSRTSRKSDREEVRRCVFRVLHSPPIAHGLNRTSWRIEDINALLRRLGTPVSEEVIREIIHSAGYQWKKARKVLTSNDPEYRQKLDRIHRILAGLEPEQRFFSIDEFGPVAIKLHGGTRLVGPGECPTVPQFQKSKGRLLLIGALELSTNQLTHFYADRKSTDEMVRLIDVLLEQYRGCHRLYLSWDAASWHGSRQLVSKVWEANADEYHRAKNSPQVELVPLPAGAQFLNVIESVFSGLARAIIHNSDYESLETARAAVDRYISDRNEHFRQQPRRAGSKIWGKERVVTAFSDGQNCKDPKW